MLCALLSVASCSANAATTAEIRPGKIIKLLHFNKVRTPSVDISMYNEEDHTKGISEFKLDLGMSNVPVLDQGSYGTCVTFASTAAMSALHNLGDNVSQQASLELVDALGEDLWDGAYYPSEVIDPLKKHGVAFKKDYPRQYPVAYHQTTLDDYKKYVDSEASKKISDTEYAYFPQGSVYKAKAALDMGHRVLIGFLVNARYSEAIVGFNVIKGKKQYVGGLWACQQGTSRNYCQRSNAGHEVVVTGYDDEQKLFKIRNSWGTDVGENGEYYMTYMFFDMMVMDMTEIY